MQESVIRLEPYLGQDMIVYFLGGRTVQGTLRGVDHLGNMVLDSAIEMLQDPEDKYSMSGHTRDLGFLIVRGTAVSNYCYRKVQNVVPMKGFEESIPNPYVSV